MDSIKAFNRFTDGLTTDGNIMPVLFIGHGSPMNGIEQNDFTAGWAGTAASIQTPTAVLVVSAHWLTRGTHVTAMEQPRTIHDFGGFPEELFKVQYPAPGDPVLAKSTADLVKSTQVGLDHDWGLDHGTWTVVRHMYPDANVPVLQLSIDYGRDAAYHYALAAELRKLRERGVLIIGSGNMVHNLRMVAWDKLGEPSYGYDWALEMNEKFKLAISDGNHDELIHYSRMGKPASLAIPTPDHYYPLIYMLGLQGNGEPVAFFNDRAVGGSLTMTSVRFG
ncbi:4,5-DOPA dioxygenase extradiol [Flavihumibacter petaseus]|uniref:4,5-DOPA-extradiol dioxygenase n=1 Tax=Flavihumibacter petaseus NBRC 106054 TaxID=1220578 RepID=A0A0E9MV68_9BACT|nr:4,5-DOPA dioxygenase extradiol [Flavihumibacter petaseus]GAO41336.1 4,5-DOPA-extradiol dioxygenase [Flavihumibacter petaseus NBRC 106054]